MSEHRLAILTRHTHGDGVATETYHVVCPRHERALDAEVCWACPHVEGATRDDGKHILVCTPELPVAPGPPMLDARETPVSSIMTGDVHCVSAELGLDALADLFLRQDISGAPVVDPAGRPIGVVTKTDLLRALRDEASPAARALADLALLAERPAPARTVDQVMMPVAFTIPDVASVAQAAALLAFERVHRVPVVSREGKVVGIVSTLDIARFVGRASGYLRDATSPPG
jgi:CBS domain-containing protein